jgi:hypothetical protein
MGIGWLLTSNSQSKKSLEEGQSTTSSTASPGAGLAGKNNLVSIVEHKFKRMNEAHDRIRNALLASRWQNSR